MRSRSSRTNNGYIGQNRLSDDYGVISENKNYLRSNQTRWIRPANWLPLPSMTAGDRMFAGLLAVYPGDPTLTGPTASGNFVAFSIDGCNYTVDWGDGTTQSYSAGVQAQNNFDFGSISAATTVTGVEDSIGYRQTVIKAYPTVAGTTISGIDLSRKYSQAGYTFSSGHSPTWLDIRIAGSEISAFSCISPWNNYINQFEWVGDSQFTSGAGFFQGFRSLRSIIGTSWTSGMIEFTSMFSGCSALQTIPLLNTANGNNFTSMFSAARSLETIPLLNTANGTNFQSMFSSCSSLQNIPLLNTAKGTNFQGMFSSCGSLKTIPPLNTTSGTNFQSMFSSCGSLKTIPPLNTTSGTNFQSMFTSCGSLETIPLLNTANGTNFQGMFTSCGSLQNIPLLNTAKGLTFQSMFSDCSSLQTIPLLNMANGKNIQSIFSNCLSLQTVPLLDFSSVTLGANPFFNCGSLKKAATKAPFFSWVLSNLNLSPAAINDVFRNLPTGAAFSKTCTITNNWGAVGCDRSLATARGWLVSPP